MCGIAGIIRFDGRQVKQSEINLLTDAVSHRGPDGRAVWFSEDKTVALGHRRLAILDLTDSGRQPMNHEGRYWITLNGEIYNFIELRIELKKLGYVFKTQTDTEVILAAYKEWGQDMHWRFNGMWAFGLYDVAEKRLLLSRDRFGVKPLYYYRDGMMMMFSSEVQALHKALGPDHRLDRMVVSDTAQGSFACHGTPRTYLHNVLSLPGGYCLEVKDGKEDCREWYRLKKVQVPRSFRNQATTLRTLLDDACRLRLRSDVLIGTCLSGGVDSGSITALINATKTEQLERSSNYTHRAFCAAFPGSPIDESRAAQQLADTLQSQLDIVVIEAPSREELEQAMSQCDGPMHALAFFPIWSLYRYIKQKGITVTLDGQGPDEMLGGYRPLREALEAAVEIGSLSWFVDVYRTYGDLGESTQFSSKKMANETMKTFLTQHLRRITFPLKRIRRLFDKQHKNGPITDFSDDQFTPVREPDGLANTFDQSLFRQFFQSPLPGILNQYDRCSMANGVECRMPFMDYRVVEFVFSLPSQTKVGKGYTKRVLREAMKGLLPDAIRLNKHKIGFNAPIVDWFRGPLREFMLEQMDKKAFLDSRYFNGRTIKKEFRAFLEKPDPQWNEAWKFWPPVHLAWWIEKNTLETPW